MNDIKLLEACELCGEHLILMGSVRFEDNKLFLVKRCLNCKNRPVEEVIEVVG